MILAIKLENLIENNNKIFNNLTKSYINAKEDERDEIYNERWKFIHKYADEMNTFIWNNKTDLTPNITILFDSIPNTVWKRMYEKSAEIIKVINEYYSKKQEK